MLRLALDPLLASRESRESPPLRILDPACGEGAFLVAAYDRLKAWYEAAGQAPASIVSRHLFGVDIDRDALATLRTRLDGEEANLRWGDALTGAGFGDADDSEVDEAEDAAVPSVDWRPAFPQAAAAGGFDLVIGNPPYRRELASKAMSGRLKTSPLGRRWHQPRLDMWAYFLHRGLDLLRDGGRLAFVLPSYWTASTGARQLIGRLEAETEICDVVRLGGMPVFPHVEGRHLILSLQKGRGSRPCRIWDLSDSQDAPAEALAAVSRPEAGCVFSMEQRELFVGGQLCVSPPEPILRQMDGRSQSLLTAKFEVREGIVENPPRISRRIARASHHAYRAGEGVFVLLREELSRMELNPAERRAAQALLPGHGHRAVLAQGVARRVFAVPHPADRGGFGPVPEHRKTSRPVSPAPRGTPGSSAGPDRLVAFALAPGRTAVSRPADPDAPNGPGSAVRVLRGSGVRRVCHAFDPAGNGNGRFAIVTSARVDRRPQLRVGGALV